MKLLRGAQHKPNNNNSFRQGDPRTEHRNSDKECPSKTKQVHSVASLLCVTLRRRAKYNHAAAATARRRHPLTFHLWASRSQNTCLCFRNGLQLFQFYDEFLFAYLRRCRSTSPVVNITASVGLDDGQHRSQGATCHRLDLITETPALTLTRMHRQPPPHAHRKKLDIFVPNSDALVEFLAWPAVEHERKLVTNDGTR